MNEERSSVRTVEKIAGVAAMVAALVVLNGAWENQHNWQNLSWRIAIAAVLVVLAVAVETNALGRLRPPTDDADTVPAFLLRGADTTASSVGAAPDMEANQPAGVGIAAPVLSQSPPSPPGGEGPGVRSLE